ncbi:MAG: hypothetical protein NXI00_23505, partial [Cytophagales bacterium]|nr:hypothetical protein [Cytophagales bacterium]
AYETTYVAGAYSHGLPNDISLDLSAGYLMDAKDTWGDDILDLGVGVSKSLDVVDVALKATYVDYDFAEDDTLVFVEVSKEF